MTASARIRWALAGIVGFLLAGELACRLLPVSSSTQTGYYTDPLILTYPAHHTWRVATGWDLRNPRTLVSNNEGYAADRDFERDPGAVALIGDSYVEESMLPAPERPGAQLEAALHGSRPVYAMGAPGTALLDYAERIRYAHDHFGVRDFVVLMERGDVRQSLCGSGNVHGPCLDRVTLAPRKETLAAPSPFKRTLRHSALAQYLFGQLKIVPEDLWRRAWRRQPPAAAMAQTAADANASSASTLSQERVVDAVTRTFFDRAGAHVSGRLVIVVDSDRTALRSGRRAEDPLRARFISLARARGAVVVDTAPIFAAHAASSSLALQVGPYDGHLNALGVGIVARAAAQALEGTGH